MQVIRAEKAGFCTGVSRAIKLLLEKAEEYGKGATYGPLVHNAEVVRYLEEKGIHVIDNLNNEQVNFVAIRTHGLPPEKIKELEIKTSYEIINLTCPRVTRVQKIARKLDQEGLTVLIYGDSSHPEVEGLVGWAGDSAQVVGSVYEMENLTLDKPTALLAQTTSNPAEYDKVKELFLKKMPDGQIFDTICPETGIRQEAALKLAQRVDAFVVVGSQTSANTRTLFDSCRHIKPTCLVANAGELDPDFVKQFKSIGVTAGASTPPWTIKEVVDRMENESVENVSLENLEEENQEVAKEVSDTEEEVKEEQFDFSGEVVVPQVGEQVTGKVARATEEEVYVDIGAKTEAILPLNEVHLGEGQSLAELFSPEDDIEVTVLDIDEQDGKVIVSHKRLARDKRLKELDQVLEEGTTLEGKVKQVVPAGIVVDLGSGIEGFMPGSLVDTRYIPDFNEFKDKEVSFKIIEHDQEKNKLILSRRKIMEEENAKKREDTLQALEVDSTVSGTVKRLTDFGAFVDVGGIDGLVHISEISWDRVKHPKEVLKVGDVVDVKVLEVIPEKDRISLSIRKTQPDPWNKAVEDLESEQVLTGKVTRLVNFGAFIEIKPGVEGLAHISQLADYHVKHPSEVLSEGEEVEVKVIEVKPKAKRISLSLKDARGSVTDAQAVGMNETENGNVTLGDVFGDLFDSDEFTTDEQKEEKSAEENAEPEEGETS